MILKKSKNSYSEKFDNGYGNGHEKLLNMISQKLLSKKNITEDFSLACADQFVAYYMGQGQRKKSWEQPFMKWVMREWVDAQKKQYREKAIKDQQGFSGERDQARTRQDKRERITNSVMDINNIDWI